MISLSNIHKATPKQILDQAFWHLLSMTHRSARANGACRYRLGESACALGAFISEVEYLQLRSRIEGVNWSLGSDDVLEYAQHDGMIPSRVKLESLSAILSELQYIHDRLESWDRYGMNERGFQLILDQYDHYNVRPPWALQQLACRDTE